MCGAGSHARVDRGGVVVVNQAMKRAIPWVIAAVAVIVASAAVLQMHNARERYWKLALSPLLREHLHSDVRKFIIKAALAGLDHPVVVIGDSITEMARFPEVIGGHPVVNAGIGGATISDFETFAPHLLERRPSLIIVALGTNDIGSSAVNRDYQTLLSRLKPLADKLIAVGVPGLNKDIKAAADSQGIQFVEMPARPTLPDGIHLTRSASASWVAAIISVIPKSGS